MKAPLLILVLAGQISCCYGQGRSPPGRPFPGRRPQTGYDAQEPSYSGSGSGRDGSQPSSYENRDPGGGRERRPSYDDSSPVHSSSDSSYKDSSDGYGKSDSAYGRRDFGDGGKDSGYGKSDFSYGRSGPSYGYGRPVAGYGFPSFIPPELLIEKLWERVNDIERGNKFAAEALDALDARMSLLRKFVDELTLVVFPGREREDENQNSDLELISSDLDQLEEALNALDTAVQDLYTENNNNINSLTELENLVAEATDEDIEQDGPVSSLASAVQNFKSKLFLVLKNEFELFTDKVEVISGKLDGTKTRETLRMCETGSVTLSGDDRRAEYIFQSDISDVPSVLYSITGMSADLDARSKSEEGHGYPFHGGGYPGYNRYVPGYYGRLSNAMGALVVANPTERSVTFETFDLSFGDTALVTIDVDFQVCSILPGSEVSAEH